MAGLAAPLFGFAVNWFVGVNTTSSPNAPYLWLAAGVIAWWLADRRSLVREPGSDGLDARPREPAAAIAHG